MRTQRVYTREEFEYRKSLRNQAYVDGSAAKQLAPAPQYDPHREKRRAVEEQPEYREEPSLVGIRRNIDIISAVLLVTAILVTSVLAIRYLNVSARITEIDKSIASLNESLQAATQENDSMLASIADGVDLNEVYRVAVGELGMVYPNNNQVIHFTYENDGYVRQYGAIPETDAEQKSTVFEILNRLLR